MPLRAIHVIPCVIRLSLGRVGKMRRQLILLVAIAAILGISSLFTTIGTVSTSHVDIALPAPQAADVRRLTNAPPPNIDLAPPPPPARKECLPLDASMVHAASSSNAAGGGIIFATFANHAQLDFALNWIAHLDALALASSSLVGATDSATQRGLARAGTAAHCFPLESAIGADEAKWGSAGFSQMGRTKAKLLRTLLGLGATVFFADADVAFLRDPLPYVQRQLALGAQLLFHTDGFGSSPHALATLPETIERPSWGLTPELNTGLFVATPKAIKLAEEWCAVLRSDEAFANWKNDQQTLNQLVRAGARASARADAAGEATSLISAFNGQLMLGLLPAHLFPSGHVYFIQRQLRRLRGIVPYAVHLTFQNCDQSGKRHRMREARLWAVDGDEHYRPSNGLLSYTPDLPPELTRHFNATTLPNRNLKQADDIVAHHFRLVNHQLLQLRTALRLAHLLNRTLVLPRFLCGLETVTNFAHSGVRCRGSNGCATLLPYWCPADHVLRMHYIAGVMPQTPQVPLRILEHSALRHPASPSHTPQRVVLVDVTGDAAAARPCAHCEGDEGQYLSVQSAAGTATSLPASLPALPVRAAAAADTVSARSVAAARANGARSLEVAPGAMSDADVHTVLGSGTVGAAELLHISSLRPEGGLGVQLDLTRSRDPFVETLKPLGGGWCCVEPTVPRTFGHYWYDALFDVVPHTDRFGRAWSKSRPWAPTPGP